CAPASPRSPGSTSRASPSKQRPANGSALPAARKVSPPPPPPLFVCPGASNMSGSDARALSRSLLDLCRMRKLTIATAESCTGGLVPAALSDIPGSSDVIDRGFVTYSNDAKRAMLGVKATTLATFGAVSKETATAMAIGALAKDGVDPAVSIPGSAGPGGAPPGKPVGLVHFAVASRDGKILHRE